MDFEKSFWSTLGYAHKSWLKRGAHTEYTINPDRIFYKPSAK
jgi:hypothetical protein